jgi:hypothetical protein
MSTLALAVGSVAYHVALTLNTLPRFLNGLPAVRSIHVRCTRIDVLE